MQVFVFTNKAPGSTGTTCVSAPSVEVAWEILKKNAYQDCDVKQRYELQANSEEVAR